MIKKLSTKLIKLSIIIQAVSVPLFKGGAGLSRVSATSHEHKFGSKLTHKLAWFTHHPAQSAQDELSLDTNTLPEQLHPEKDETRLNKIQQKRKLDHGNAWSDANFAECARLWDLNEEEKRKMLILREKLADVKHWMNDPYEVVRFLMEYKGDLEITEHKFRGMIKWRINNNVDKILADYTPPPLFNYFPVGVLKGVDRDGDPIHLERTGASDMLGMLEKYGRDEMIKHAIWIREQDSHGKWHKEYQRKQGRHVKKFTVIADMQGFNMRHLNPRLTPVGKEVTRLVQDNYPGLAKKIIVIRAPTVFRMAWSMFKPFIDPNMREIVEFSNARDYEEVLRRYIDPEILPPVVCEKGKGEPAEGFQPIWEGGSVAEVEKYSPRVDISIHHTDEAFHDRTSKSIMVN